MTVIEYMRRVTWVRDHDGDVRREILYLDGAGVDWIWLADGGWKFAIGDEPMSFLEAKLAAERAAGIEVE